LLLAATAMTGVMATSAAAAAGGVVLHSSVGQLKDEGTVNVQALSAAQHASAQVGNSSDGLAGARIIPLRQFHALPTNFATANTANHPRPTAVASVNTKPVSQGFIGLSHYDQRILADNGNQFSLEPPDQALAVGDGFEVEAVNDVLEVYGPDGKALLPAPLSMNQFFNQPSQYNRTNGQYGPFLSDPRAYFDWQTGRFIVAEWATLNDAQGHPLNISVQFLAVSATSDPTGSWHIYSYDTTNSGTDGCPCIPDFNQLGGDANGVFITSSLFSMSSGSFEGSRTYVVPKHAIENGASTYVAAFPVMPNDFTIHPTVAVPHGYYASELNGTEYFVETTDDLTVDGTSNILNIWAASGTNTLNSGSPSLTLTNTPLTTETVDANLPHALQKDGYRPLGGYQHGGLHDPLPMLDAGDGRVGSTPLYVNGVLNGNTGTIWAVAGTAAIQRDGSNHDSVAWFQVSTTGTPTSSTVNLVHDGIISAPNDADLLYPAIAMDTTGHGGIGVTLTDVNRYPSTAYIRMPEYSRPAIVIEGLGKLPDDGFTAYGQYGGRGVGRWGDYGAAEIDGKGNLWFANEYIPPRQRSSLANWGTFITKVLP